MQLNGLKLKIKDLEKDVALKDNEVERLRDKTSKKAHDDLKHDLEKSYHVMRHLKNKSGYGTAEYADLVKAI